MTPRVILAHALRWPNVAHLSGAFCDSGFVVGAIAVADHPIHRMRSPDRTFIYRQTAPRESLREAIETFRPDLIIPCDDRVVAHLSSLYRDAEGQSEPAPARLRTLIETSLGRQTASGVFAKRASLADLSRLAHVHVPQTDTVESSADLRKWVHRYGLPAILKLDGTWAGQGAVLIRAESGIPQAMLLARARRGALRGVKRALFDRDLESALRRPTRAAITVQSYVAGRLANAAVACWRGEVIADVAVEVVRNRTAFGTASVVQIVEGEAMIAAARSVARHFELSGFYGFDFVLDETSGEPKLIEINPRATQINHFACGAGHDLPGALRGVLSADGLYAARPALQRAEIAMFPQEWQRDRRSPFLSSAFHDVPYDEPEMCEYYGFDVRGGVGDRDASSRRIRSVKQIASSSMRKLFRIAPSSSGGTI